MPTGDSTPERPLSSLDEMYANWIIHRPEELGKGWRSGREVGLSSKIPETFTAQ